MMHLPEDVEKAFQVELEEFEEARKMKYVTTIERMAEARGEARGGKSMILRLLNHRFGEISLVLTEKIEKLSIAQLETLGESILEFSTIDDLVLWLADLSET